MKKYFRLAAIAVLAMGLTVACKSKTEAPVEDTLIETIVEDTVDTIEEVAEEVAVEEPTKPAVKKEEKKESKLAVSTDNSSRRNRNAAEKAEKTITDNNVRNANLQAAPANDETKNVENKQQSREQKRQNKLPR